MNPSNSDAPLSAAELSLLIDTIQTRMTALLGVSQRLLDSDLQGEQRQFAESIDREVRSLLHSINTRLDPAPPAAAPEVAAPPSESAEDAKSDTFVLVVDDNVMNRNVLEAQLAQMGIQHIELAAGGKQAVEAVQRDPRLYQLIFMDCEMPLVDGFEATRQIRAFEVSSATHVPIIALTAGGLGRERERCLEAGMDDYLSKPVSFKELKVKVEHWL